MKASRVSATLAISTAMVGSALAAVVSAPFAHADSLGNVVTTVNKDRAAARCPQLTDNPALQDAAGAYARSENIADSRPGNYNGLVVPYLGSGDPQAAAINSAYRRGAGETLSLCNYTDFGVGFVRHDDRSVDVVTILFGIPGPPPRDNTPVNIGSPVRAPDDPPANVPIPASPPPAAPTATVTSDVDLYDKPNVPDGAGKIIGMLRAGTVVKVAAPCPSDDWCLLLDPAGAAYGSFFRND